MQISRRYTDSISNLSRQAQLVKAIVENNISVIKRILKNDNSNMTRMIYDENHRTPLHLAAALGRTEIIDLLLHYECFSPNNRDRNRFSPLHRACRNNHATSVRTLLCYNADVNARSRLNVTVMHICAAFNSLDCARLINSNVNNINATDSFGATSLHYAVYNDNFEMIQFLIENGAKADMQDEYGQRPIHYASAVDSPHIIRYLVEHGGADVNVRNKDLLTPLHFSVAFRNPNAFRALIELNANIEAQDINGNKVAHWAALIGCEEIFDMIMELTSVTSPNLNGITPLHFSCSSMNSFSVAIKLMQNTSDIDVTDKFNRTPLHYAAMNGNERTATELISRGANCNFCDVNLEMPIHKSTQNCHISVINLLNRNGALINSPNKDGFTALHLAVMAGLPMNCMSLIQAGANPLLWDSHGRTPHFLAVYKGSFDCFVNLMKSEVYKSIVNEDCKPAFFPELDAYKRSLLHYAAASNVCSHEFLEFLLLRHTASPFTLIEPKLLEVLKENFRGFNINQKDTYGRTPLHYVCRRAMGVSTDIDYLIKMFVECGADRSLMDEAYCLPLHYAIANGYTSSLSYLIDPCWLKNDEIKRRYFSVSCPLKIAAYYDKCSAINELIKYGFNDFKSAIEVAVRRFNWSCVDLMMSMCNSYNSIDHSTFNHGDKNFIRRMALFTAYNGVINGLRIFIKFINNFNYLLLVASLSKMGFTCVELLLEKGADFHFKDRNGRNALFYAVIGGNVDTIKLLLNIGVKFVKDKYGQNVFHFVASNGDISVLNLLYSLSKSYQFYGYLCNFLLLKDIDGLCPIEIACLKGHQQILEYYVTNINKGFEERLMYFAGLCANMQFIQYLLKKNGAIFLNFHGSYDRTLLHYSCMSLKNNIPLIKLLLDLNFDVNSVDDKGLTPLLCSAYVGNPSTVSYLLENTNCNLLATDNDGNSVLHLACLSGSNKAAMTIINFAKEQSMLEDLIVMENNQKQSCLHLSAKKSLSGVIQELILNGASVTEEDVYGYTPTLYCARDPVAAYCLLIMETFLEQEFNYIINNESIENGQTKASNRRSILSDNSTSSDKRKSFRDEWQTAMENRIQRLSITQHGFPSFSSKASLKDGLQNMDSKDKPTGNNIDDQLQEEYTDGGCQTFDSIVDSDSELY